MIVAIALALGTQTPAPTKADWTWLDQHRERALEAFMPVAASARQLVAYRSYRDLYQDEHEAYFAIDVVDGPVARPVRLSATLVVPIAKSIQEQLLELHMSDRQATLESLLPRVNVRRRVIANDRCPALRARVEALFGASFSSLEPDVIVLHPMMHRIVIANGSEHVDATLIDPENSAVRWAVGTLEAIQACDAAWRP